MNPLRVAIVGYGIAGIAAAIQLRARGHHIDHFERRESAGTDGAGLLLQPPTQRLLGELGLDVSTLHGTHISGYAATDLDGRNLTTIRYADHAPGIHGLGIQRQHLVYAMSALDAGRQSVLFSHAAVDVDVAGGILHFSDDSERGPYDLIIAADGTNSVLRRSAPEWVQRDSACASAAAVFCVDDPRQLAGDRLVQYFDTTRHVAVWPVGAIGDAEPKRTNISINVAANQAETFCASGAWRDVFARHCPHLVPLIDRLDGDFKPTVYRYRDVVMSKVISAKLAFMGDAAHSMSPLLGQGARLALLDAATLARSLEGSTTLAASLDSFDRSCRRQTRELQWLSRWLTPIFQNEGRVLASLRHAIQLAQRIPMVSAKSRDLLIGEV